MVAVRSLDDRGWAIAVDFGLRLLRVVFLLSLWRMLLRSWSGCRRSGWPCCGRSRISPGQSTVSAWSRTEGDLVRTLTALFARWRAQARLDFMWMTRDFRFFVINVVSDVILNLAGVRHVRSEVNRHHFTFDAARTPIPALLQQATGQTTIHDVETHRSRIDDVIAEMYEHWDSDKGGSGDGGDDVASSQG